jgi:predicted aspartyl protease
MLLMAAAGLTTAADQPGGSTAEEELSEVVVTALEPRYVSPTRRDSIGRIWAPVMINGKGPFRLVLDTGASHSAITDDVAHRLGISLTNAPMVRLRGVTGTAMVPIIEAQSLIVGELLIRNTRLPIVINALGGAEGVLGTEGFEDKRIFIDFHNDLISIMRSHDERAPADAIVIPIQQPGNRLLLVDAYVGGIKTQAIIDTGGQATIGNLALRNALVRRRMSQPPTVDRVTGSTNDVQDGDGYAAPPIQFDRIRIQGAHVTFGDMHIFEHWGLENAPAMLIGMETLGLLDTLVIDYHRREIQMRLRPSTRS